MHDDARKMHRTEVLVRKPGEIRKSTSGERHDLGRRVDRHLRGSDLVQKMLG